MQVDFYKYATPVKPVKEFELVAPEAYKLMHHLIALNNIHHQQEVEAVFVDKNSKLIKKNYKKAIIQPSLFD